MSLDIRPNPSVTGSVTGSLVYQGSYDAATNTPDLTSSSKGDFYIVSVGGTLAGVTLNVGDHIVFNQNASSPITSAMFDVIDNTDAVASVNTQTGVVVLDSDDISEGATNQYFTSARFDTQLATKDSDDITEGATNQYFTTARFDSSFSAKSTTDLSEGTNLYYTDGRFDTRLATKDSDDITEGATNQYFTSARFDSSFSAKSTTDLSEGTNLYFTDARADARIGAASVNDLSDVAVTTPSNGQALIYNSTSGDWENSALPSAPVTSVNTQTGAVVLDTDDVSEGSTNLYYTDGRFDTRLATKSTTDLSEGTNLYYTDGRFDTRLAAKSTTDLSEGTNLYFTDARADARADLRIAAANIDDLNDVTVTTPSNGQVLLYNSTSSEWENGAVPSAPVTSVNTQTGAVVLDTDDISEGATNLYYTNARFDTQLATKSTTDLSEGTNLYYTDTRFDTRLAAKSTTDLSEGTNLYYTDARADARIGAANIDDLNDVTVTTPSNGQVLLYNSTSSEWENGAVPSAPVTSVNTQTGAVSLDLDDVVTVGATTTTAITTGGLTVSGDIDPNADVTYYIGDENNRFISYYGDMNGAIRFKAKVDQTGGLSKGEVVYINGLSGGGSVPTVAKAQANSSSTMPAFGLVYASANDTADVEIITFGNLEGLVTNTFTAGTNLYVSSTTAGGLVNSAPTGESNLIQNIGFVVKSDASAGIIKVGGAGRTNATPNLDQDKIFLGNGSNQAVSTALSSVNLSSFNQDLTTSNVSEGTNLYYTDARADARIGAADLTDLNDVSYTAGPPIDNYVLTFDNSTSTWGAEAASLTPPSVTLASPSTDYTISTTSGSEEIYILTPSADINVNLPAASTAGSGYKYQIKNMASANSLTIDPNSTETIDGSSTYVISNQYESITIVTDGSNWFII